MQLTALVFSLAILIMVALYLYAPFLERRARRVTTEEHELSSLLAERERAINALQELDFDYSLGKVPEADYPAQRTSLLQKGAEVLRRLDELTPSMSDASSDARIERALKARRKQTSTQKITDDEIESLIVHRRKGHKTKTSGFCPKCGKAVLASDKFCPACGKPLG